MTASLIEGAANSDDEEEGSSTDGLKAVVVVPERSGSNSATKVRL